MTTDYRLPRTLILLAVLVACLAIYARAESPEAVGIIQDGSILLTKSSANYVPASTGIQVSDRESFGIQFKLEEAVDATPAVTFTVQGSMDQTNWVTYTQNVMYPATAAATASWAITAETTYYLASIQPGPVRYLRIVATETAADDDVTLTYYIFQQ